MTVPTRSCAACRARRPKPDLVRLVVDGGSFAVDRAASSPGRGAYVCRDPRCLDLALRRDGAVLRRALRQEARTNPIAIRNGWERAVAAVQSEVSA